MRTGNYHYGSAAYNAKLTEEKVAEMRRLREQDRQRWSYIRLGIMFGVSEWTARDAVTYRTWGKLK